MIEKPFENYLPIPNYEDIINTILSKYEEIIEK